jgi:hypothetical protein
LTDCLNGHLNLPIEKHLYRVLSIGLGMEGLRSLFVGFFKALSIS